jgi:hypothetical protein
MYTSNARLTAHNYDVMLNGSNTKTTKKTEVVMFNSMHELRAKNKEIGHKFFDRELMKQFNSKVESALFRGRWFIMSEKGRLQTDKRRFKVWEAKATGEIVAVGGGVTYPDRDSAKKAVKAIVRALKG